MKEFIRVTVIQEDIDKASLHDSAQNCVVAQALKRRHGPDISCGFASLRTGNKYYDIPEEAKNVIHDFVDGKKVEPFTFDATRIGTI